MCLGPCSYSHEIVKCNSVHQIQQTLLESTVSQMPFKGSEIASALKMLMVWAEGHRCKRRILPKSLRPCRSSHLSRKGAVEYSSLLEWGSCALVLMTSVSPGGGSLLTFGAVSKDVPCISEYSATLFQALKC